MSLMDRFPSVAYLEARARRRMPRFAWEFVASGTGDETLVARNAAALAEVRLAPRALAGKLDPDLSAEIFGRRYDAPFGAAPIGMAGLMWPGAELALADAARAHRVPTVLSTVASADIETVAARSGGQAWFQLYPPKDAAVIADLMARCRAAGVTAVALTVDVPVGSRRERQRRAGITLPPRISTRLARDAALSPAYAAEYLRRGRPRFRGIERYAEGASDAAVLAFIGDRMHAMPDWAYFSRLRELWDGALVIKGVLRAEDAAHAVDLGADGIWVSNHGGRQLDAAPVAIEALPAIVEAVGGRAKVLFDSGLRSGLDVARALALGADFAFFGRAFMFGLGALGAPGAAHVAQILKEELANAMIQLGAASLAELPSARV